MEGKIDWMNVKGCTDNGSFMDCLKCKNKQGDEACLNAVDGILQYIETEEPQHTEYEPLSEKYPDLKGRHTVALRDCLVQIDEMQRWSMDVGKVNKELLERVGVLDTFAKKLDKYLEQVDGDITTLEKNSTQIANEDIVTNKERIDKHDELMQHLANSHSAMTTIVNGNHDRINSIEAWIGNSKPEEEKIFKGLNIDHVSLDKIAKGYIEAMGEEALKKATSLKPISTDAMYRKVKYGMPLSISPGEAVNWLRRIQEENGVKPFTYQQAMEELYPSLVEKENKPKTKGIPLYCPLCGKANDWGVKCDHSQAPHRCQQCGGIIEEGPLCVVCSRKPGESPIGPKMAPYALKDFELDLKNHIRRTTEDGVVIDLKEAPYYTVTIDMVVDTGHGLFKINISEKRNRNDPRGHIIEAVK